MSLSFWFHEDSLLEAEEDGEDHLREGEDVEVADGGHLRDSVGHLTGGPGLDLMTEGIDPGLGLRNEGGGRAPVPLDDMT